MKAILNDLVKSNDSVKLFTLNNERYLAKITSVFDGDSCKAVIILNDKLTKFSIRMYGYNTPELKPRKTVPNRDTIIADAKRAKFRLQDLILFKMVILECFNFDKYGRLLANVYIIPEDVDCNNLDVKNEDLSKYECICQKMVDEGFGKVYYGGKR